jgi:putative oligomerization/nucleic acid binding protein
MLRAGRTSGQGISFRVICRLRLFRNMDVEALSTKGESVSVPAELTREVQGEPRLLQALEQIASLLVPGETIEAWAVQRRFLALTHRRALVAATTGRLIDVQRGLFGGFQPRSVRWQDLKEARIAVGVFGASLTVSFFGGPDLAMAGTENSRAFTGLRKDQAEAVYRVCQAQDQAWREKRRVRELEEMRARSGGIQLGNSGAGGGLASPSTAGADDTVTRLEKAKAMLDKGLISDAEFEAIKARIVNTL